jgi:hypothetical protein
MKNFIYQIDGRGTAKGGLISLSIFTLIFIGIFIFFYINYDDYSTQVYSLKYQRNVEKGWGPSVVGWGMFGIPMAIICIFLLSLTRDFKKISCGIDENELFLNANMIKATSIPFSNIKDVSEDEHFVQIRLNDYSQMIKNQFFLFRGTIKNKYVKKEAFIQLAKSEFEEGKGSEVAAFLKSKIKQA